MTAKYDLLVVGGGISGLGVAYFAALQGRKVCLCERASIGGQTSASSLRIIHGGLRYLQQLHFGRVITSLADQTFVLRTWPELVKPLRCIIPISGKGLKRKSCMHIASLLYAGFLRAAHSPLRAPRVLGRQHLPAQLSFLAANCRQGIFEWSDGLLLDPGALHTKLAQEIRARGGEIHENCEVKSLRDHGDRVEIQVHSKNAEEFLSADFAINTAGAWMAKLQSTKSTTTWSRAFNVTLNRQLSDEVALGIEGEGGRLFFFVPRGGQTALGTAYLPLRDNKLEAFVSEEEVTQFIRSAAMALPSFSLSVKDVASVECGLLPAYVESTQSTESMKGSELHEPTLIAQSHIAKHGRLVDLMSTKYTTFRSQALKALSLCGYTNSPDK